MRSGGGIELSVIIPTLNEVGALPCLLADLAAQRDVEFEVLISDGGSDDGTREVAAAALVNHRLTGKVLTGPSGRGRQLNRGATLAKGDWLLFVHADSRFHDPSALSAGLAVLRRENGSSLAGRFALRFEFTDAAPSFDYYLCEVKARTGFPGTIHGDQGFLLTAGFFRALGGFREDLPVMEDTLLAEEIRTRGQWLLLPAEIVTSPRRFRVEGYAERQTLNALLMNFAAIGWDEPLCRTIDVYRAQDRARTLQLGYFYALIDGCLGALPLHERLRIWRRTGEYVRGNAWQLVLRRVARGRFAAGLPPDAVPLEPVVRFRRRFEAATDHSPGRLAAMSLTWLWFRTRRRKTIRGA